MAFTKTVSISNKDNFGISPEIRLYNLRDAGFIKNPNNNVWVYIGILEPVKGLEESIKLKVYFNDDLETFRMNVVNANENINIDIYSLNDQDIITQYKFITQFLIERNIITSI